MINVSARRVLLLNVSFQPVRVISVRAAVDLLLRDAAEAVEGVAAQLRTPNTVFTVPSVLRLRHYVRAPQRNAVWGRYKVLRRDMFTCIYCGIKPGELQDSKRLQRSDMEVDHLIPVSKGGKSTWSNTACACRKCNHGKADRTPHEAGLKLLWEPKLPRVDYLILSVGRMPDEWKFYLQV